MRAKDTQRKLGQDIEVGDIIVFLGTPHRITRVEPYTHPTVEGAVAIAHAANGWGISLWRNVSVEVA